jgi:CheY-like chemotaxis protein
MEREALLKSEQRARERAEAALQRKDEFIAKTSHELRTPLSVITSWIELLRSDSGPPKDISSILEIIDRNARQEMRLIDDLLDVARLRQGKTAIADTMVSINQVVSEGIESISQVAKRKDITIKSNLDAHQASIRGDKDRTDQILWNLLGNAVKFTPAGGEVTVSVKRGDGVVEIEVKDTGIGINPDFLPYVFTPFEQQDSSISREFTGLGLGLAIAKGFTEQQGGSIQVQSEGKGKGSTFTVSFPLIAIHAVQEKPAVAEKPLAGMKVLIVDDMPDVLQLMFVMLKRCGAEVHAAESVDKAVAILASHRPTVVISDIAMPGKDGFELLRTIKSNVDPELANTPVIALSANDAQDFEARIKKSGFRKYLVKPTTIENVTAAIFDSVGKTANRA